MLPATKQALEQIFQELSGIAARVDELCAVERQHYEDTTDADGDTWEALQELSDILESLPGLFEDPPEAE